MCVPPLMVDLEGVEPSSEQGNHRLSTCLSLTSFSCSGKTKATNRCLIFFEFRGRCEATVRYPRFGCTTVSGYFRAWCRSDVSFLHLVQELSDPTVLQIKQRERSCFRQIIVRKLGFECQQTTHCMLTYHFCLPSKPVRPDSVAAKVIIDGLPCRIGGVKSCGR